MTEKELLRNAMIGCAVGDALGWPYEFDCPTAEQFGDYYDSDDHMEITDDTQMSLFTLDGMVHALKAGVTSAEGIVNHISSAYLSWYVTQRGCGKNAHQAPCRLMIYRELYATRAPAILVLHHSISCMPRVKSHQMTAKAPVPACAWYHWLF